MKIEFSSPIKKIIFEGPSNVMGITVDLLGPSFCSDAEITSEPICRLWRMQHSVPRTHSKAVPPPHLLLRDFSRKACRSCSLVTGVQSGVEEN